MLGHWPSAKVQEYLQLPNPSIYWANYQDQWSDKNGRGTLTFHGICRDWGTYRDLLNLPPCFLPLPKFCPFGSLSVACSTCNRYHGKWCPPKSTPSSGDHQEATYCLRSMSRRMGESLGRRPYDSTIANFPCLIYTDTGFLHLGLGWSFGFSPRLLLFQALYQPWIGTARTSFW